MDKQGQQLNKIGFETAIFSIQSAFEFNETALDLFRFQAKNNSLYRDFLAGLQCKPNAINNWLEIPCLPIGFFKTHQVRSTSAPTQLVFESSGTTGQVTSRHEVAQPSLYEESFMRGFSLAYGDLKDYCILALLPAYLERPNSSLVYMAEHMIEQSMHPKSGFFLHNQQELALTLAELEAQGQKTLLLGVTFALLDLAETHPMQLNHTIVMETGGMKGRREELIREEVHDILKAGLGVREVHSEYGMTELLSQAYSKGDNQFHCPPWMNVSVREVNDAQTLVRDGRSGGLNVIDLANVDSCAFLATQDLGRKQVDGSFEVLGRFDNSDVRGCNLMVL